MIKINGFYYLDSLYIKDIEQLPPEDKRKWDKRDIRNIYDES